MADHPSLMRRLASALRRHPVLFPAFGLALAVFLVFAVRSTMFAVYWADPAHRDQQIEGWMTPAYVSHSWHVPREVMEAAIGSDGPKLKGGKPTLDRIAREEGVPTADLIARIETAIATHRDTAPSE